MKNLTIGQLILIILCSPLLVIMLYAFYLTWMDYINYIELKNQWYFNTSMASAFALSIALIALIIHYWEKPLIKRKY